MLKGQEKTTLKAKDLVLTKANYSVDDKTRHWTYFGLKRTAAIHNSDIGGSYVEKEIEVHNGRNVNKKQQNNPNLDPKTTLTLDEASFELVSDCKTSLSTQDFYAIQTGDVELTKQYYNELKDYIKKKLQCDKVYIVQHQVRNGEKVNDGTGVAPYATGAIHTDSSAISADQFALQHADEKYERYLYLNIWRNISDKPIENDHLAVMDERTAVKPDDYIPKDFFGQGYSLVQYGLNARHASIHKWYYFPNMHRDECILFKQFDSDWTKQGRICFHMSINDAQVKNHLPRESIEARILCFWKKADSGVDSMPTSENVYADMIKDPLTVAEDLSSSLQQQQQSFNLFSILNPLNHISYIKGWLFPSTSNAPYNGNPQDYVKKFVDTVDGFDKWPVAGKNWAIQTVGSYDTIDDGIKIIGRTLVDDAQGYFGTRAFSATEKKCIVDCLVENEEFMNTARKHFIKA